MEKFEIAYNLTDFAKTIKIPEQKERTLISLASAQATMGGSGSAGIVQAASPDAVRFVIMLFFILCF